MKEFQTQYNGTVPGVNILGDLTSDSSVGEVGRRLYQALCTNGIPCAVDHLPYAFDLGSDVLDQSIPICPDFTRYGTTVVTHPLHAFARLPVGVRQARLRDSCAVGYWAVEAPIVAPECIEALDSVDEIWSPSTYSARLLREASDTPVHVVPHAVAPRPSGLRGRKYFGIPEDAYVVLFAYSALSGEVRKNAFGLINAFANAASHPSREHALLVLKIHHSNRCANYVNEVARRVSEIGGLVIKGSLPREAMDDLTAVSDCIMSLHRAEGFGLHLAEAMALEKPVVATGYSGNVDFMSSDNSFLVEYAVAEAPNDAFRYQPEMLELFDRSLLWANPSLEHAVAVLEGILDNPHRALTLARLAREDALRDLSPQSVGRMIRDRLFFLDDRREERE